MAVTGAPATSVRIPGLGFPDSMVCNLRYCDTVLLSISTGSMSTQKLRWNSTFDPDYSLGGHQPLYRDTFASVYDHYAVVSAYVEIQFVNTSTVPVHVGAVTDDDSSVAGTVSVLREQAHGVYHLLPAQSGSLSTCTLRLPWDCKKILRIDPYASEEYKTAVGSNPAEESYLNIWSTTTDGLSNGTVVISYTLVQQVLWTELATPSSS